MTTTVLGSVDMPAAEATITYRFYKDNEIGWQGSSVGALLAENASKGYGTGGGPSVYMDDYAGDTFFQTYYSLERFIVECVLAALAAACNITALVANKGHTYQHPAYHILFKNLTVANALAVLASWITNNSIYFFMNQLTDLALCHTLLLLLALNLFSMAFGLISGMTLVGFGVVHYLAICWPLRYASLVTVPRTKAAVLSVWISGPLVAFWPMLVYLVLAVKQNGSCDIDHVGTLNTIGSDVAMGILAVCYLTLSCMCLRLYHEVRMLQQRLSANLWLDELKYEKKALVTILMLLSTLTVFFIPYYVVYMVSMNSLSSGINHNQAVLYYMMLLPYVKYATDPIIYGKRMLGLQEELKRKLVHGCCMRIAERLRSSSSTREDATKKGQMYQMVTMV